MTATPRHKVLLMFLVANKSFIWETHLEALRPTLQVRFAFPKIPKWVMATEERRGGGRGSQLESLAHGNELCL